MGILEWFASLDQYGQSSIVTFGLCILATVGVPLIAMVAHSHKRWELKFNFEKEKFELEKLKFELEKEKMSLQGGRQKLLADAIEVANKGNHTPLALLAEKNDEPS